MIFRIEVAPENENHNPTLDYRPIYLLSYPRSPMGPDDHRVGGRHCARSIRCGCAQRESSRAEHVNQSRSSNLLGR